MLPGMSRLNPGDHLLTRFSGLGQRTQIVLPAPMNVRSDRLCAHLAVSHKQQPYSLDDLKHPVHRRTVQRIVRAVTRYHLRYQRKYTSFDK
jgi:hypothetical protein